MGRTKKRPAMTTSDSSTPTSSRRKSLVKTSSPRRQRPAITAETGISTRRPSSLLLAALVSLLAVGALFLYNDRNFSFYFSPETRDKERRTLEETADDIPSHQKVSYFRPYSVDQRALLRLREENMKRYDFPYSKTGIDRRSNLSLQEFRDVYDAKWPVILTDVVPTWSAFNWSRDFLFENYGKERVTMKAVDELFDQVIPDVLPDVYPFTAVFDLDFHSSDFKKNSLDQAVSLALPLELFYKNTHKAYPNRWTYVEDELFISTHPQLKKDIGNCDHLEEDYYQLFPEEVRPWNAMLLWGTQFSRSSLHIDPYNWTGTNAVLKGRKKWKLFPPGQDHLLYVMRGRKSGFPLNCYKYNSPVDAYDIDMISYPAFTSSYMLEFEQLAGELLIIPTGWFHQAFNMEETIAISSQVMNRNNFRIVLEEIIKAGNVKRPQLPAHIDDLSPVDQVKVVMSLLPQQVLERGRHVTEDALYQIQHGYKDKQYQLPLDD